MTKVVDSRNQIWHEVNGERVTIGLTRSFLDTLDECWHILPGGSTIKAKAPLMTIETNDSLVSILSPVAGSFVDFNPNATNFPDKLTENDVVMTITTGRQARTVAEEPVPGFDRDNHAARMRVAEAEIRARLATGIHRPAVPRATAAAPRMNWATGAPEFAVPERPVVNPIRFDEF
jgi:glycine cleavage system H lipoate-binding protein